jgi:hypothetical protein
MSDHDEFCPTPHKQRATCDYCHVIDKVRADERGRFDATVKWVREDERATARTQMADLRAKVQELYDDEEEDGAVFAYADVLALFDGSGDD